MSKTITKLSIKTTLLVAALTCAALVVLGQNLPTHTTTLNISSVTELRIKPSTNPIEELNFENKDDLDGNVAQSNAIIMQVASNEDWIVNVRSETENFTYTGPINPEPVMPSSVLKIRWQKPGIPRINLSNTDTQIANGTPGYFDDNQVNLRYIAIPKFNYPEGSYTINVLYTVVPQ